MSICRCRPSWTRTPKCCVTSWADPRSPREAHEYWAPICADTDADAVGLGWWVGWSHSDGGFLGWWDLSPDRPVPKEPLHAEAGWRLARRYRRQGFATEGARTVLDHGFATVGLGAVWAKTMAVNQPSRNVMVKLGMHYVRTNHRQWAGSTAWHGAWRSRLRDHPRRVGPRPLTDGLPVNRPPCSALSAGRAMFAFMRHRYRRRRAFR